MKSLSLAIVVVLTAFAAIGCGDDAGIAGAEDPGTSGPASESGAGPESGPESGDDSGESGSEAADTGAPDLPDSEPPTYDGDPLPPAAPGDWVWVDFPEAECIDGSAAGIGVRYGRSDKLVIFFEGGGGCFNEATCSLFYASFAHFDQLTFDLVWQSTVLQGGIFSTLAPDNPVRDWNFVYVPYCTGDVHIGDAPDTPVPGFAFGEPQQFVGFRNFGAFMDRIVPTFTDAPEVLVAGISAGGFGAAFNYDRVAEAFPAAAVSLIDDSGPPLTDDYLAPCLQARWRELWKLDASLPLDCAACFTDDGGGISALAAYLAQKHGDQRLGLVSAERDLTIRTFFGYGLQSPGGEHCPEGIVEQPMDGAHFEEGLYELRAEVLSHPNFASYYLPGTTHTALSFPSYYTTTVQGVRLVDWVASLLAGQTQHVSPI
jgi:hypothetical protein